MFDIRYTVANTVHISLKTTYLITNKMRIEIQRNGSDAEIRKADLNGWE